MKKVPYESFNIVIREQFGEYPSETEIRGWYDDIRIPEKNGDCYELRAPHSALMVPQESAIIPTGIEVDELMFLEPIEGAMIKQPVGKGHIVVVMTNIGVPALDIAKGDIIARGRFISEMDK